MCNSLKVGTELADMDAMPDKLGLFIPERLDHRSSITRHVTNVKSQVRNDKIVTQPAARRLQW